MTQLPTTEIVIKSVKRQLAAVIAQRASEQFTWTPSDEPIIGLNANPTASPNERFVVLTDVTVSHPVLTVRIPKGFACDLASVPRAAWWIAGLAPTDQTARAGLLHDFLTRHLVVSRYVANAMFETALEQDGVRGWRLTLMSLAVRYVGKYVYRKYMRLAIAKDIAANAEAEQALREAK